MDGCYHTVDFDDIDTTVTDLVSFTPDRYEATMGVIINGFDNVGGTGQYVSGNSFGYPVDFPPVSQSNVFTPGPEAAVRTNGEVRITEITFTDGGVPAGVSAFGAYFIDADNYLYFASKIIVYNEQNQVLAGFDVRSDNGGQSFAGIITKDTNGTPVPAIYKVVLWNGNCWPTLGGCEGVVLDDFVFGYPTAP